MQITPQERLVLSVVALLLAAGTVVRYTHSDAPPAGWTAEADSAAVTAAGLGQRVGAEVERGRRRSTPLAAGERIDPNTADADELQRLPRVGPALAARIVAHREANGPFRTLADLDAVSGIGPALLAGVAPHLTLPAESPAATPRETVAPRPLAATAPAPAPAAPPPSSPRSPASAAAPLDLNRATAEELLRLPGVGPVLAERIVEWRRLHGPFRSVEDLRQVSGIGARKLEQIAPHVRVGF